MSENIEFQENQQPDEEQGKAPETPAKKPKKKHNVVLPVLLILIVIAAATFLCIKLTSRYTVQFMVDDAIYAERTVKWLGTLDFPEDPTKEEYVFDGWYLGTERWDENTKVKGDTVLVAKFRYEHEKSDWITDKAPSCTEEGQRHRECTKCGEVLETETIAKVAHKYESNEVAASCEGKGYTEYVCYVCSDRYTENEKDALGHNFINNKCTRCSSKRYSDGLDYKLSPDGGYYMISGAGDCTDANIIIPETYNGLPVTTVSRGALAKLGTALRISISKNLTVIEEGALAGCVNLEEFSVDDENPVFKAIDGDLYTADGKALVRYAIGKTASSFTVPENTENISESAFKGSLFLRTVYLPSSLTSIEASTFAECEFLASITVPDSVSSIKSRAFENCKRLTDLQLGYSVKEIEDRAFYQCQSLISLTVPASVEAIGQNAFQNCYKLVEICNLSALNITTKSTTNGYVAYYALNVYHGSADDKRVWTDERGFTFYANGTTCYLISYSGDEYDLILPESVNENRYGIYKFAFYENTNIVRITIPEYVKSIDEYAFLYCHKLIEVENHSNLSISAGATDKGHVGYYARNVYKNSGTSYVSEDQNGFIFYDDGSVCYLMGCATDVNEITTPASKDGKNYEIYK